MFSHYSYSETSASRRRFCDILFSKTQIQTIMQEIDGHCKKPLVIYIYIYIYIYTHIYIFHDFLECETLFSK